MAYIIVLLLVACFCDFVFPDSQGDGDALYALKISLNATGNELADWNSDQVNPCTWSRVYCDQNYRVVQVQLAFMGLTGFLTPRIGALTSLTTLSLQGNEIIGDIPKELGNLTNLTRLDLESNRLTGEIPSSFGKLKKLQFLTLSQNNLSGAIPESVAGLPGLINVLLDSNNLTGQIPEQFFKVPKYKYGPQLLLGRTIKAPLKDVFLYLTLRTIYARGNTCSENPNIELLSTSIFNGSPIILEYSVSLCLFGSTLQLPLEICEIII